MSFYLRTGALAFAPTRSTESAWDAKMQHGGPPAALLGNLLGLDGLRLARISVDFLGPIPRRPFTVEISVLKPGRLTALNEARMVVDGRVAVIARAWHLAPGPQPATTTPARIPAPRPAAADAWDAFGSWGYGEAIEWRLTHGSFDAPGETHVWTRVLMPLVDDEELTGQDRALIVADSANGLSAMLPMDKWLSIPPTMTTTLLRPAAGEWVHLACTTELTADGVGLAGGDLSDELGRIGQVTQPLLVRQR